DLSDEVEMQSNINDLLREYDDFDEVQVISDNQVLLGTSDYDNRYNVGKKTTEQLVKLVMLEGKKKSDIFRNSVGDRIYVLGYPMKPEGDLLGVIYVKASMEEPIYDQVKQISQIFVKGIVISLVITVILGVLLSRTITKPVSAMRKYAMQIAHGDFSRKVKV